MFVQSLRQRATCCPLPLTVVLYSALPDSIQQLGSAARSLSYWPTVPSASERICARAPSTLSPCALSTSRSARRCKTSEFFRRRRLAIVVTAPWRTAAPRKMRGWKRGWTTTWSSPTHTLSRRHQGKHTKRMTEWSPVQCVWASL